jgi:hypothetical protein
MPDPEFTLIPGTITGCKISLWGPLKDEIFMTQNIRTSNGRQTIKINRLGRADDQRVRHFISSITLTDAGHGDVLGPQHKGNALLLWVNWSQRSGSSIRFRVWLTRSLHPADPFIDYSEWSAAPARPTGSAWMSVVFPPVTIPVVQRPAARQRRSGGQPQLCLYPSAGADRSIAA